MNVIFRTRNTPPRIRGYLRRFFSEADRNLFVGKASRRVVDSTWERITSEYAEEFPDFTATLILFNSNNEQGFELLEFNKDLKFHAIENSEIHLFEKSFRSRTKSETLFPA